MEHNNNVRPNSKGHSSLSKRSRDADNVVNASSSQKDRQTIKRLKASKKWIPQSYSSSGSSITSTVQIDSERYVAAGYNDNNANNNSNNLTASVTCVAKADSQPAAEMTEASSSVTKAENRSPSVLDSQQSEEFAVIAEENSPGDDDHDTEQTILNEPHVTVDGITTDHGAATLEETLDENDHQALAIHNHHDDDDHHSSSEEEERHDQPLMLPFAPDYQHLNGLLRRVLHQVQLTVRDANGDMRPQWYTVNEVTFSYEHDMHLEDPFINRRDIIQVGDAIITCSECFRNYQSDAERIVGPLLQPGGHTDNDPIPATPRLAL